jgi:hypothetical protein
LAVWIRREEESGKGGLYCGLANASGIALLLGLVPDSLPAVERRIKLLCGLCGIS